MTQKRSILALAVAATVGGLADRAALAMVWNGTDHPERGVTSTNGLTDKPGYFANVDLVFNTFNSTRGTATYLGNGWIITARHMVQAENYGVIAPPSNITFAGIAGAVTVVAPDSAEIALVKLQSNPALSALSSSVIYTGFAETNKLVQMGGFGLWGFIDGSTNSAATFHRGYNISWINGSSVSTQTDGEQRLQDLGLLETGAMSGDSGSALWLLDAADTSVNDWAQYKLAGILATSQGGGWGADSNYARVANYWALIKDLAFGADKPYGWSRGIPATFSWNNSTLNGDVTNGNNWNSALSPAFPNAAGAFASAGAAAGANNQILNLDQNITVGEMSLGTTNNGSGIQTVAAGGAFTLTFDNLSAPAVLMHNPQGRADVISAPMVIAGSGTIMVSNPSATAWTFSGSIASGKTSGTQSFNNVMGTTAVTGSIADGSTGGRMSVLLTGGALVLSGSNSYTGGTTLNGGTLTASSAGALGPSGAITFGGGTLQHTAANQVDYSVRFSSAANQSFNIDTNGQNVTYAASFTSSGGSLTKVGAGKLTLLGSNGYTGDTSIQNGTLSVTSMAATGTGARINFGAGNNTGMLLYTGAGQTSAKGINLGAGTGTGGAAIDQSGSGLLKFTGANTATGGQKHTLTLQGSTAGVGEIAGAIVDNSATNNTSLVKAGTGVWVLSGANTYSGATTATAGKLQVTSSLTSSSAFNAIGGVIELTAGAGGTKLIKTSAVAATSGGQIDLHDNKLIVSNAAAGSTFNGTSYGGVAGLVATGYHAGAWDGAGVITSETAAKSPSVLTGLAVASAAELGKVGQTFAGQLLAGGDEIVMYTYGGDADLNGTINGDDYFRIDSNINTPNAAGWYNGDFNHSGRIDGDDYFVIDSNVNGQTLGTFPTSSGSGPPLSDAATADYNQLSRAVPEPASLGVVALIAGGFVARRRRREE